MTAITTAPVFPRAYRGEPDFWRVRQLLIETYPLTPTAFNWEIRRWDGWNTHRASWDHPEVQKLVHLWETEAGKLVGVVHPEGDGEMFLELHPHYRHIEAELFAWGEANLAVLAEDQTSHRIDTFVMDYDAVRQRLVEARGYVQTPYGGVTRRLRLSQHPLPAPQFPPGFQLRTTRANDWQDCEQMAALLNAAFQRTIHTADEYFQFMTNSPSFRHDLNLVAEAPDGTIVSHVGVTYDGATKRGIFEPVCTHPDYQRKGLARALMVEGLHRLRALGASDAYVDTGDGMGSNWLYEAVGFTEVYHGSVWRKCW